MSTTTLHRENKSVLVPKLRFSEFYGEWSQEKVGKLCDSIVPGRNKPTNFEGDIPWITTPDIEHNGIIKYSKKGLNISKEEAKKVGSKIVPINSIVISCVGELGLSAISGKEIIINQQLHAFIPYESIHNKFLLYQLNLKKKYMDKVATKTAVPYMNKDNCNSIPIDFPSLPEQQKIASFLSAVDEKIQQLSRKKELLQKYKKGVMQQLFSGKLRFKDENGKDYADWEEKKLGNYLNYKSNRNKDFKVELVLSVSNKKGFISQDEQFDGYEVASKDLSNYKVVDKNDIAYNPSRINVGSIARLVNFERGIVSPMYIVFSLKKDLDPVFFENLYNTHLFKHLIKIGCSGSVRDSLNFEDLAIFNFNFPSLEEQQNIANFLASINSKIENTNQQIIQTQNFKKGLLQQMFV